MKTFIIGPCSLETYELSHEVLSTIYPYMKDKDFYFKGSFDKANRSSIKGKRGPGLEEGMEIFKQLKKDFPNLRVTTDIHETNQVEKLSELIDLAQIPAFLCRQTDLLVESARFFNKVNIKKGQWMSPQNMVLGIDKLKTTNPECEVWLTERGTSFGYSQFVVDFSSVDFFKEHFDKVIFDVTHSAQLPKDNGRMGGNPKLAARYFKTIDIFNYDGVFVETHPNPSLSYSDADSVLSLKKMIELLKENNNE
jgi:2-dehydro-3-deoxyphosphooctonate aldolase (KDO 8-P synthase)